MTRMTERKQTFSRKDDLMGEAKRRRRREARKQATLAAAEIMNDVGVPLPREMPSELDLSIAELMFTTAADLRRVWREHMETAIQKEPDKKVNELLGLIRASTYKASDELIETQVSASRPPLVIACHKGCAWCCHQNVEVSIPEAILIAVETGSANDLRGKSVDQIAPKLAGLDDLTRAKTGQPCPFLGKDQACTIYDIRPLACRGFCSPDAAACKRALDSLLAGEGDTTMQFHVVPQLLAYAARAATNGLLKDLGLQYDDVDLVATIAAIRKDPNLIDRWAQGKHVFAPRGDPKARLHITLKTA